MAAKVEESFTKRQTLIYNEVGAFAMKNELICSIMDDDEFKKISADVLDYVSREIADEFNYMLGL